MNLRRLILYSFPLFLVGLTIFIIQYQLGFFYYTESNQYIGHYLGDQTILQKLYDFRGHDEGIFRPRELGNLFNMLDAYVLAGFAAVGFPHFISVTHILAMIMIASTPLWLIRKRGHDPYLWIAALLLGLLFMLSPVPLLNAYYLRVSKSINALVFMIIFVLIYTANTKLKFRRIVVIGLLTVCLGIIDETGLVSILILGMFSIGKVFISKYKRNVAVLVITIFLACLLIGLYRNVLSPWMVTQTIGLSPQLWVGKPIMQYHHQLILSGVLLFVNYCSGLFGGFGNIVTISIMVVLTIGLGWILFQYLREELRPVWFQRLIFIGWPIYILLFILSLSFLLAVMINHHPMIMRSELTHSYYQLPFLLLAFTILIMVTLYCLGKRRFRGLVLIGLLLLTVVNLIRLPVHFNYYFSWSWVQIYVGQAFPVIELIKQPVIQRSQFENSKSANTIIMMRRLLHRPIINDVSQPK